MKTIKAKILSKKDEGAGVKTFVLEPQEEFDFKAGQWAFFEFEANGKKQSKPFSFSNSPAKENLEFTTEISQSEYKQSLNALAIGSGIEVRGPMGMFHWDAYKGGSIIFLAGGIGITPMKSMIEYAVDTNKQFKGCLFYSNRNCERVTFQDELEALAEKIDGFEIIHTLTCLVDEEAERWHGETDFINPVMIDKYAKQHNDKQFFLVGPPAFNEAMEKMLKEDMKVDKDQIVAERFMGY